MCLAPALWARVAAAETEAGLAADVSASHPILWSQKPVRVLLQEATGSVTIRDAAGARTIRHGGEPSGVRVDGGAVIPRWRDDGGNGPLRVGDVAVRGALEVFPTTAGTLWVINEVPIESYLAGTLGREMYGSWSPAALKAQAVASRTYAVAQMKERWNEEWHVHSGTLSQVYAGVEAETDSVKQAVRATAGEILVHAGEPILAAFHSSSGGRTASALEVWGSPRSYLVSMDVENEWESPDAYWRAAVSRTTLGRAVAAANREIGSIRRVKVLERTGSGRVARVRLSGERGEAMMTGRELRDAVGEWTLKSTLFEVKPSEDGFAFVGSGNGHGVGMSQWGARAMAERGDSYQEILRVFYPGTALRSLRDAPAQLSARQSER